MTEVDLHNLPHPLQPIMPKTTHPSYEKWQSPVRLHFIGSMLTPPWRIQSCCLEDTNGNIYPISIRLGTQSLSIRCPPSSNCFHVKAIQAVIFPQREETAQMAHGGRSHSDGRCVVWTQSKWRMLFSTGSTYRLAQVICCNWIQKYIPISQEVRSEQYLLSDLCLEVSTD